MESYSSVLCLIPATTARFARKDSRHDVCEDSFLQKLLLIAQVIGQNGTSSACCRDFCSGTDCVVQCWMFLTPTFGTVVPNQNRCYLTNVLEGRSALRRCFLTTFLQVSFLESIMLWQGYILLRNKQPQAEAFVRGLWEVIDPLWLQMFSEPELQVRSAAAATKPSSISSK